MLPMSNNNNKQKIRIIYVRYMNKMHIHALVENLMDQKYGLDGCRTRIQIFFFFFKWHKVQIVKRFIFRSHLRHLFTHTHTSLQTHWLLRWNMTAYEWQIECESFGNECFFFSFSIDLCVYLPERESWNCWWTLCHKWEWCYNHRKKKNRSSHQPYL